MDEYKVNMFMVTITIRYFSYIKYFPINAHYYFRAAKNCQYSHKELQFKKLLSYIR